MQTGSTAFQCNLLQDHTDLLTEHDVEHDKCPNFSFGEDSCDNITTLWILSRMPLISIENVYYSRDLDRGQTDLIDVFWVGL